MARKRWEWDCLDLGGSEHGEKRWDWDYLDVGSAERGKKEDDDFDESDTDLDVGSAERGQKEDDDFDESDTDLDVGGCVGSEKAFSVLFDPSLAVQRSAFFLEHEAERNEADRSTMHPRPLKQKNGQIDEETDKRIKY